MIYPPIDSKIRLGILARKALRNGEIKFLEDAFYSLGGVFTFGIQSPSGVPV